MLSAVFFVAALVCLWRARVVAGRGPYVVVDIDRREVVAMCHDRGMAESIAYSGGFAAARLTWWEEPDACDDIDLGGDS